jgi:hypothetical protein
MPHRFRTLSAFTAVLAFALPSSALAASGPAEPAPVPVPADAPTGAILPSGAAVIAFNSGETACAAIQMPGVPRPAQIDAEGRDDSPNPGFCGSTPTLPRFNAYSPLNVRIADGRRLVIGYAGLGVAQLQFKDGPTLVASTPVLPAGGTGPLSTLRF